MWWCLPRRGCVGVTGAALLGSNLTNEMKWWCQAQGYGRKERSFLYHVLLLLLPTPAGEINIHIFFLSLCHPEDYALCTNNNCDLFAAASDETTEMGALLSNLRCSSGRFECEAVVSTNRRGNWVRWWDTMSNTADRLITGEHGWSTRGVYMYLHIQSATDAATCLVNTRAVLNLVFIISVLHMRFVIKSCTQEDVWSPRQVQLLDW